jgi:hypothetical protein
MNQETSHKPSTPQASSTAEQAKQRARDLAADATDEMAKLKAAGEKKVRQATESVKATTHDYAKQKKSQAASEVGVFRDAVQKAADKLSEQNHGGVAGYVSAAAEQLDRLRESIEDRNVGDLFGEAQRVARKHPEIVYGGMFVAGLALMRFLKASNDGDQADQTTDYPVASSRPDRIRRGQRIPGNPGATSGPRSPGRQPSPTTVVASDTFVVNPRHNA